MRHLLIAITFILISLAANAQNRENLLGDWEIKKFVNYKSAKERKKITSKKEWSPKTLQLKDDGSFTSTEISYTDGNEEKGQGKWSEKNNQLMLDYYYKDGSLQSKGEPVYIAKINKSKLVLVYSSNVSTESAQDSNWGKTYVTFKKKK